MKSLDELLTRFENFHKMVGKIIDVKIQVLLSGNGGEYT